MIAGAEPVDTIAQFEMSIVSGTRTLRAEHHWANRAESVAAWLLAEWESKWISADRRGKGRAPETEPPATRGDDHDDAG